jgi:hypothetical protein
LVNASHTSCSMKKHADKAKCLLNIFFQSQNKSSV